MILAAVIVVVAALVLAREVLLPFALAILVSFLLTPLVSRLERWGLSRIVAVVIVAVVLVGAAGALGYVLFSQVTELAESLPQYKDNITAKLKALRPRTSFQQASETLEEIGKEIVEEENQAKQREKQLERQPPPEAQFEPETAPEDAKPVLVQEVPPPPSPLEYLEQTLLPFAAPLTMAGMTLLLVMMILIMREDLRDRFIRLIGLGRLDMTTRAVDDATKRISRYLLMQLIVNATYGLPVGIGLYFIGVPNPALWGILAMLLRFIPYLGPWIAAAMPILISLAVFDDWYRPMMVIGLFLVLELISNNVMEPWLYGMRTGISPMAVVAAALFWTWVWGPVGLIVSTPITVCLVVLGRYAPQLEFLYVMLTDEPVLAPRSRFYQRLLAMDHEEVLDLAEEYLEEHSLLEFYSEVAAPALRLAEGDRHRGRLDEPLQQFIYETVREVIDDLGEAKKELEIRIGKATKLAVETKSPAPHSFLAERQGTVVLCLPARDTADELAGRMFTQLLQTMGYTALAGSVESLASERLDQVETSGAKVVCVSAMPPSAARHARYLCKLLSARFGTLPQIVCLWDSRETAEKLERRVGCEAHQALVTNFADGLEQVRRVVQPMIFTQQQTERDEQSQRAAVEGKR